MHPPSMTSENILKTLLVSERKYDPLEINTIKESSNMFKISSLKQKKLNYLSIPQLLTPFIQKNLFFVPYFFHFIHNILSS